MHILVCGCALVVVFTFHFNCSVLITHIRRNDSDAWHFYRMRFSDLRFGQRNIQENLPYYAYIESHPQQCTKAKYHALALKHMRRVISACACIPMKTTATASTHFSPLYVALASGFSLFRFYTHTHTLLRETNRISENIPKPHDKSMRITLEAERECCLCAVAHTLIRLHAYMAVYVYVCVINA